MERTTQCISFPSSLPVLKSLRYFHLLPSLFLSLPLSIWVNYLSFCLCAIKLKDYFHVSAPKTWGRAERAEEDCRTSVRMQSAGSRRLPCRGGSPGQLHANHCSNTAPAPPSVPPNDRLTLPQRGHKIK